MLDIYIESKRNKGTRRSVAHHLRNFFVFVLKERGMTSNIQYKTRKKYTGDIEKITELNLRDITTLLRDYEFDEKTLDKLIKKEKKGWNRSQVVRRLKNAKGRKATVDNIVVEDELIKSVTMRDLREYIMFFRERYANEHKGEEIEETTVSLCVSIIKRFYGWAEKEQYIEKSPINPDIMKEYRRPKNKKIISLSLEDSRKLITTADNPRDKAILLVFLTSGVRNAELCNLEMDNVDFENNTISVIAGKCNKDRTVIFSESCKQALRDWLTVRKYNNPKNDNLFVSMNGRKMLTKHINRIINDLGTKAKIKVNNSNGKRTKVHPHLLRHTFATQYLKNGGNLVALQELMGHATLDQTRRYIDLSEEFKQQDYSKAMANLF